MGEEIEMSCFGAFPNAEMLAVATNSEVSFPDLSFIFKSSPHVCDLPRQPRSKYVYHLKRFNEQE